MDKGRSCDRSSGESEKSLFARKPSVYNTGTPVCPFVLGWLRGRSEAASRSRGAVGAGQQAVRQAGIPKREQKHQTQQTGYSAGILTAAVVN